MKSFFIMGLVLFQTASYALAKSIPKSVNSKSVLTFVVENKKERTLFSIQEGPKNQKFFLDRQSTQLKNTSREIPKGLAEQIQADLLNLVWETKYKAVRSSANVCEVVISININAEENVKVCEDQLRQVTRAHEIEKQLNQLLISHSAFKSTVAN